MGLHIHPKFILGYFLLAFAFATGAFVIFAFFEFVPARTATGPSMISTSSLTNAVALRLDVGSLREVIAEVPATSPLASPIPVLEFPWEPWLGLCCRAEDEKSCADERETIDDAGEAFGVDRGSGRKDVVWMSPVPTGTSLFGRERRLEGISNLRSSLVSRQSRTKRLSDDVPS